MLAAILEPAVARPLAFAGDFNRDPFRESRCLDAPSVEFAAVAGFSVPNPEGEWSFINHRGTASSRVDRVAHTPTVSIRDPWYVTRAGAQVLAGPDHEVPISDHAALVFEAGDAYIP